MGGCNAILLIFLLSDWLTTNCSAMAGTFVGQLNAMVVRAAAKDLASLWMLVFKVSSRAELVSSIAVGGHVVSLGHHTSMVSASTVLLDLCHLLVALNKSRCADSLNMWCVVRRFYCPKRCGWKQTTSLLSHASRRPGCGLRTLPRHLHPR